MNFTTWKEFYQWGWATKEQIAQAVQQGILTDAQYQEIVGSPYPAAKPAVVPTHPATVSPATTNTPETQPATQPVESTPVSQPATTSSTVTPSTQA